MKIKTFIKPSRGTIFEVFHIDYLTQAHTIFLFGPTTEPFNLFLWPLERSEDITIISEKYMYNCFYFIFIPGLHRHTNTCAPESQQMKRRKSRNRTTTRKEKLPIPPRYLPLQPHTISHLDVDLSLPVLVGICHASSQAPKSLCLIFYACTIITSDIPTDDQFECDKVLVSEFTKVERFTIRIRRRHLKWPFGNKTCRSSGGRKGDGRRGEQICSFDQYRERRCRRDEIRNDGETARRR
mmetsp:Transcript_9102/g.20115  ORF Transcript_9102/g.20115 Transcript_9102/m.20115 type:complete len:239 (-) Transcript_9102:166-882(-)